jgi:hypothetical protein
VSFFVCFWANWVHKKESAARCTKGAFRKMYRNHHILRKKGQKSSHLDTEFLEPEEEGILKNSYFAG